MIDVFLDAGADVNARSVWWAGGFGVLGASTHSPEHLEAELRWIDRHVEGRPYGVDVIIPVKYDAEAERDVEDMSRLIPAEHRAPGTWMHDALQVRDDWESRLLRTSTWSPLA